MEKKTNNAASAEEKVVSPVDDAQADASSEKGVKKNTKIDTALQNFTQKTIAEPPKRKYGWIKTLLLLAIIGVGIYLMAELASTVGDTELRSLGDILANLNVKYTLISLAVLLAVMILESSKFVTITRATTGQFKLLDSIKVAFLGKYYDGITPFGSGGQPMQIMYLHRKGHSAGESTAIIMIKYFFNMFCWVAICMFFMIFNKDALYKYVEDPTQQTFFMVAGWVGWAINAMLPASVIVFAIFPKITDKILRFFINVVTKISLSVVGRREKRTGVVQVQRKIKILRRKEKWIKSAHTAVGDFRASFIVMSRKPLHFIILILTCIVEQFLTWAFPYFILIAFANGSSITPGAEIMFAIMTLNIFATMSVAIVPTPGSSGVLENVILLVFKMLASSVVFWVVFTWRFLTYYVYILIGLGITCFEVIRNVVRSKRAKKINEQTPPTN